MADWLRRLAEASPSRGRRTGPRLGYGVALAAVLAAFAARVAFEAWLDPLWLLFFPAVLAAALVGGLGPGLAATALSALLTLLWILPAKHPGRLPGAAEWLSLALSAVVGAVISLVADGFRRSRRAEDALRATHRLLARHVEGSPLAVVEWDAGFRVTSASARAEALFGWSAADLVGKRIDEIPWVPPEA